MLDTSSDEPTVAIHAQLLPGSAGGIETNLLTLLAALSGLEHGGRQVIIGPGGESPWLAAHLGSRQSLLAWPVIHFSQVNRPDWVHPGLWELGKRVLGRQRFRVARRLQDLARRVRIRQGTEEHGITQALLEMGVQAVHFPYQSCFPTGLPTIYEPWDLQHRHYPEFFTPQEISHREEMYRTGCDDAALIVAASSWGKRDLIRQFGVIPGKIAMIRRGAGASTRKRLTRLEAALVLGSLALPDRFILYPAKTWPHKNHIRLLKALALLRDRHRLSVPLVCTGKPVETHWPAVRRHLADLALERTVVFTGHLGDAQMAALFSSAEFLIFPSLFEGLGVPLLEAMQFGLPVVTSNVTCLPEVAGDAALYFDPLQVDSIADAIQNAWSNPSILEEYRAKGSLRLRAFDWNTAARQFRACYRYVARGDVGAEDSRTIAEITADAPPYP